MLVVTGIPLYFLESAVGQFCSQGSITVWRAAPILQGETERPAGSETDQAGEVEIRAGCWLIINSGAKKKPKLLCSKDW